MGARPILGALAALILTANAPATDPTPEQLRDYAKASSGYRSYPMGRIVAWEKDLRRALAGQSIDQAADALAPAYGLSPAVMRALVRAWLDAEINEYDFKRTPARTEQMRAALIAVLNRSGRNPLVLQAVAESLDRLDDCRVEDFDAMMQGAKDRAGDAWRIANSAVCTDNFSRYLQIAPDRPAPGLIRQTGYGGLEFPDSLPVYAWLTSPAGLAHIAEADRERGAGILYREYTHRLFATGLTDRAIALLDGLPPAIRAVALSPDNAEVTVQIDGLPVSFREDRPDDSLRSYLAAAYALAGREAEARALLAAMPEVATIRRLFACAERPDSGGKEAACKWSGLDPDPGLLILDHLLDRRGEDPYPIAEYIAGHVAGSTKNGPFAELTCRVFDEAQYAGMCENARAGTRGDASRSASPDKDAVRAIAAIDALALPELPALRTDLAAALSAIAGTEPVTTRTRRTSIDPDPPFTAQALPAAYRDMPSKAAAWPKDVAPLPEGFSPVRIERKGPQATAISISQNLDPTGEVTGGGYWVHLSEDGGKHWQAPLYTGLAQAFPYVVPDTSAMPLRNGDSLDLAVEVALIDTATIMYPPVATRTRKREKNLFIKLPLADLRRDSDADGITDVAARHLLIDRARDGGTPFIVGTDRPGTCTAAPTRERLAIQAMLRTIFEMPTGAMVTTIDNKPGDVAGAMGRPPAIGTDRPMLIEGDPADFACLRTDRLMIVYGAKDIEALQRHAPDFRTVSLPRIVYNRARDRGYVVWSAGFTGGTYRMRLVGGVWKFDSISSWIT